MNRGPLALFAAVAVAIVLLIILALRISDPSNPPAPVIYTWPTGTRTPVIMSTPGTIVVHGTPYACVVNDPPSDEPASFDFDAHNCPGVG